MRFAGVVRRPGDEGAAVRRITALILDFDADDEPYAERRLFSCIEQKSSTIRPRDEAQATTWIFQRRGEVRFGIPIDSAPERELFKTMVPETTVVEVADSTPAHIYAAMSGSNSSATRKPMTLGSHRTTRPVASHPPPLPLRGR